MKSMTHLDQSELQTKTSKWQPSFSNSSAWKRQEPNKSGCIHQITLGYHVIRRFLWVPNLTSNRKNKTDWWLTPQFLAVKLLLTKKCLLWPLAPRCWVFAPPSLRCWWPYESERRQMWCKWNQVSRILCLGRTKSAVVGQDRTGSSFFTMWTG